MIPGFPIGNDGLRDKPPFATGAVRDMIGVRGLLPGSKTTLFGSADSAYSAHDIWHHKS
jgi:hypothetical protein